MKDKKRYLVIFLLIIILVVGAIFFVSKNNGKKVDDLDDKNIDSNRHSDAYNIIKKITIDRLKYGKLDNALGGYFVFNKGNKYYLLDNQGKELKNSNSKIELYDNDNNDNHYYMIDNVLYSSDGKNLYSLKKDYFIRSINNQFLILFSDEKYIIVNLETKEEKKVDEIFGIYDGIIVGVLKDKFLVYDQDWKIYNKLEIRGDNSAIRLSNDDEEIYLSYENGKLSSKDDYNIVKLNDKYYLDYSDCGKLKAFKDNQAISDACFTSYQKSPIDDNFVALVVDEMESPYLLINDDFKELKNYSGLSFAGQYFMAYLNNDDFSSNIIYLFDNKGNSEQSICPYSISYVGNNIFSCTEPFYSSFINDKTLLDKRYKNISCNDKGYCDVEVDDVNGKHALYYLNEEIIKPYYGEITFKDDYIILSTLYAHDILFISKEDKGIDLDSLKPIEKDLDIDVDKLINDYHLTKYENLINDNKELFKKYAYTIENNDGLGKFKQYLYDYFKVIVDKKKYLNEYIFFDALSTLKIKVLNRLDVDGAAGLYYDNDNHIEILSGFANDRSIVTHELMHFVDYKLNDNWNKSTAIYDKGYISKDDYDALTYEEKIEANKTLHFEQVRVKVLTEGGAEKNSSDYFSHKISDTYQVPVSIYKILEYIFGEDEMDRVYYGNSTLIGLFKDYIDKNTYSTFIENSNTITELGTEPTDKMYSNIVDTIVDIYISKNNKAWSSDKMFSLLLYQLLDNISVGHLSKSKYYSEFNKLITEYNNNILVNVKNKIRAKKLGYTLYDVMPIISIEQGKVHIYYYCGKDLSNKNLRGYLNVEYNIDNGDFKVLEYIDKNNDSNNEVF